MTARALSSALIILLLVAPASAQERASFETISIEQGLSESVVNCMLQDRYGFLWIGTQNGLNKFNGYEFTHYRMELLNPHAITGDNITSLCEDPGGALWVGTIEALNKYDHDKNEFQAYIHDPEDGDSISDNHINTVYRDSADRIWVGTRYGGLNRYRPETDSFVHYMRRPAKPRSLPGNNVTRIIEAEGGTLWIGTDHGLVSFDPERGKFEAPLLNASDAGALTAGSISALARGREGRIHIGTPQSGLFTYTPQKGLLIHYVHDPEDSTSISSNDVTAILEDKSGALWVGTNMGGLNRLDGRSGRLTHFRNNPANPRSLVYDKVNAIIEDHSEIVWIGTEDGISKLDKKRSRFTHYRQAAGGAGLAAGRVFAILEDQAGDIWIGFQDGGIDIYRRKEDRFESVEGRARGSPPVSRAAVRALCIEPESGNVWVGTETTGIYVVSPDLRVLRTYRTGAAGAGGLSDDYVRLIYRDSDGTFWVGTSGGGLNRLERDRGGFTVFRFDRDNASSISSDRVLSIFEDSLKNLWIGTDKGLNLMNRRHGTFRRYVSDKDDPHSLSGNVVLSFHEDGDKNLWVGTGAGLNKFDAARRAFVRYTTENGLPNNVIYAILEDDYGDLWISSNAGLTRLDPRTGDVRNYDAQDGLQSNEFNVNAACRTRDGELFFGGVNGVNRFDPRKFKESRFVPPVVLTAVRAFGKEIDVDRAFHRLDAVFLSREDNFISLEFAVLDFTAPDKNRYKYKLEGYDKDWVDNGPKREVSYINLAGGNYVFRVIGCNSEGIWNEEGLSLRLVIQPLFWETWWFQVLVFAGAFAMFFAILYSKVVSIKKQRDLLRREIEERTKELVAKNTELQNQAKLLEEKSLELERSNRDLESFAYTVSHDLRAPLRHIFGFCNLLRSAGKNAGDEEKRGYLERINDSTIRMGKLIDDLLWLSRSSRAEIVKIEVDLSVLVREAVSMAAAGDDSRKHAVVIAENIRAVCDPSLIRVVVDNLVGNAWKYTRKREEALFEFGVDSSSDERVYFLRDNGVGFDPEKADLMFQPFQRLHADREFEGTGIGLTTVRRIVNRHGGSIWAEGRPGEGATFFFTLG